MKETGLMLKAPLVRAILEGRKTQTRREVKRLPLRVNREANAMEVDVANIENGKFVDRIPCPWGQPGDRIYVRETWQKAGGGYGIWYAATDSKADDGNSPVTSWRPSIHMTKSAARIWLEVTGVRVEQLQDISTEDCISEGLNTTLREYDAEVNLRDQFQELWESTGGDWDANPWVWVIDFKVLSTTGRPT